MPQTSLRTILMSFEDPLEWEYWILMSIVRRVDTDFTNSTNFTNLTPPQIVTKK